MQGESSIKDEIAFVSLLDNILNAYEEVSVMRMYKIRSLVLRTREFLSGLSDIFKDVKNAYKKQLEILGSKASLSVIPKNGKEVMILISSNTKLYGDIISRTFRLFLGDLERSASDIVIVGRLGRDSFEQERLGREYTYFDIPDREVNISDLKQIITFVLPYDKVTVYHGEFVNVISQDPVATDVSGESSLKAEAGGNNNARFLFEPPLSNVLSFFETQVFSSLFKQTFYESNLARYASRIRAMEQGLDSVSGRLNLLLTKERRLKSIVSNKKQLSTISGISLWSR